MIVNFSLVVVVGQSYFLFGFLMFFQGFQVIQGFFVFFLLVLQFLVVQSVIGIVEGDFLSEIYFCFYFFDLLSEVIIFCLNLDQFYVYIYIWFNMFDFFFFSISFI